MTSWNSYGKVYAIGHRATHDLFSGEVTIEEKVDGSQFSFGLIDGEIKVRSRGRVFDINEADGLFVGACATVQQLADAGLLVDGYTYRGEVLKSPKHNVLCYDRAPIGNIILFDVAVGDQDYMSYDEKAVEAERLGLEVVPLLYKGRIDCQERLNELKGRVSILGGQPIEGYVVKAYDIFTRDKKVLMGKWVSEAFKEVHRKNYKPGQGGKRDIANELAAKYTTEARWNKAAQHLREAGALEQEPKDIGPLIAEVRRDLLLECEEEIKQDLFDAYQKTLLQKVTQGLAEWYKAKLEKDLFNEA